MYFETPRLVVRPFIQEDLPTIHRILDELFSDGSHAADPAAQDERHRWLQWSILAQEWLPKMYQPPYGDLAITLKDNQRLIGSVGLVPLLMPFDQLPELRLAAQPTAYATPEIGLYWVIDAPLRGQGYALEAAQALVDFTFRQMHIRRILATTEYDNHASQRVMEKLGMQLARNPLDEPHYMQVVGFLENPLA